jgi:hypothetical protein
MYEQVDAPSRAFATRRNKMRFGPFLLATILLIVLWISGFLMFHVAGALLHLVLLFALISLVIHLFSGKHTASSDR